MSAVPNAPGAPPGPVAVKDPSWLQRLAGNRLVKKIAGNVLEDSAPKIEAAFAKARAKIGAEPLFWLDTLKIALNAVLDRVSKKLPKVAGILKIAVGGLTFLVGREAVQPVVKLPVAVKPVPPSTPKTVVDVAKAPAAAAKVVVEAAKRPVAKVVAVAKKPINVISGAVSNALSKLKPKGR